MLRFALVLCMVTTLIAHDVAAQSGGSGDFCGTEDILVSGGSCPLQGPYAIPATGTFMSVRYHLHLVRKNDGTGGVPATRVDALLAKMRADFALRGISFTEIGRTTINRSDLLLVGSGSEHIVNQLAQINPHVNAIDIYLATAVVPEGVEVAVGGRAVSIPGSAFAVGFTSRLDGPVGEDDDLGGSLGPTQSDAAMVIMSHEMGHALGLFHTDHGTTYEGPSDPCQCPELVNGSNGWTCGDYVLDTDANPTGGVDWNEACQYTGTGADANGDPYDPQATNIMSYSPYHCQTEFTAGQASRMFTATLLQNARIVSYAQVPSDLPILAGYTTHLEDATMLFNPGVELRAEGGLVMRNGSLIEASTGQGWNGIRIASGGTYTVGGASSVAAPVVVESGGYMAVLPDDDAVFDADLDDYAGTEADFEDVTVYVGANLDVFLENTDVRNSVRFAKDAKLVVEGDLEADDVRFAAVDPLQRWGGIVVEDGGTFTDTGSTVNRATTGVTVEAGGVANLTGSRILDNTLGLAVAGDLTADGITVRYAGTGVQVYGQGDAAISGSTLRDNYAGVRVYDPATAAITNNSVVYDNTIGVDVRSSSGTTVSGSTVHHNSTGLRTDTPETIGGFVFCFSGCPRSELSVFDSVIRNNTSTGLSAYVADVEVRNTEIRDNSCYGLYASGATVGEDAFTGNLVTSNGCVGANAESGANLFLSPDDGVGENRIASNLGSEVHVAGGGFAFLGNDTGVTGYNAVFDPDFDPNSFFRLVQNASQTPVDANSVYWGASSGAPQGAFTGTVDATLALACDPVFPPAPDDPNPCAQSRSAGPVAVTAGVQARSQALAERIRAVRARLAAAPDASGADSLVYRLGGLHRLDRDDGLGEWAQTAALLASVRGALAAPELPAAARSAAEAALEVAVVRLLGRGDVGRAAGLLETWGARVSSAEVIRTLDLVEAALRARRGAYAEAAALAEAVAATVGEGEVNAEARQSVETLAAHYALRAAEAEGEDPARSGLSGEGRAVSGAKAAGTAEADRAGANLTVYPNPSAARSTVAVALPERAHLRVAVYDVLGRRVALLSDDVFTAGAHRFALDAAALPSGVYVVRAEVDRSALSERITVVR